MKYLIALLFVAFTSLSHSQIFKPSISYTVISEFNDTDKSVRYVEKTLNLNMTYEIRSAHKLGIQYLNINTAGSSFTFSKKKSKYFLVGILYQYDLLSKSKIDLFPELAINYGNYCTCGNKDPFQKNGIIYISYGFGIDFPIYKNFYIDTGFHFYQPSFNLDDVSYSYAYTQYILGISYKFQ